MSKKITLAYGGGGEETQRLIKELFFRHFGNPILEQGEDGAALPSISRPVFTTDSFTISPLFFNGGDIGKLAAAGVINDLAVMGARPRYMSVSFIIEEGLEFEILERVVESLAHTARSVGVQIVTGDTKVVPKGGCDKLFISGAGIGEQLIEVSCRNLRPGDLVVVSGDVGRHGAVVMAHRYGVETDLESDCKPIWKEVSALIGEGVKIKGMRDATRGGISAVLNELAESSGVKIGVWEERIKVDPRVVGLSEIMGFEPLDLANEGTFVAVVAPEDGEKAVEILRQFNPNASIIGKVEEWKKGGEVILYSPYGSSRYLELPKGELLPRIC